MKNLFSILALTILQVFLVGCASNRFSRFKPINPKLREPIVVNFQSLGCSATDDHNLNVIYRTAAILFARENRLILVSNHDFPCWFGNTNDWLNHNEFLVTTEAGTVFDYRNCTLGGCNPMCVNTPTF